MLGIHLSCLLFPYQTFQDLSSLELSLSEQSQVLFRSEEIVLRLLGGIDEFQEVPIRWPKGFLYLGQIASILLFDGVLADMCPHLLMDVIPCDLDLLESVFGDELGDDAVPAPSDDGGHR